MFLIENNINSDLISFLKKNQIIGGNDEILAIEKPGEGNMNLVLRLVTNQRSIILKQSRDFVQKYPSIEAPIERILVEAAFYTRIENDNFIGEKMPKLLSFHPEHYLLVLEDLGSNADFTSIYSLNSKLTEIKILNLVNYLNKLHSLDIQEYPPNEALKKLNHFHIFNFPFDLENKFDLDKIQSGLQEIAFIYKTDEDLKNRIELVGNIYLETDKTLLHGDFYPGSWLNTKAGIKIIDPEFGYLGRPEFDLGVFIAHLVMARKTQFISTLTNNYLKNNTFDTGLMCAFAGVEIMRRLLGVAQLPLSLSLLEKTTLLQDAKRLVYSYQNTQIPEIEILVK